jgi:adenylate cyclase
MKRKKYILASLTALVVLVSGYFLMPKIMVVMGKNDSSKKSNPSIAILPFENMSNEPGQEYFSDGLTDGIINAVAHVKGLKVCARTSSFKFKGRNVDLKEAGEQLGVQTILEGSVLQHENKIRITVQLINVEDGFHFWSEQYDAQLDDIFTLQNKIAEAIANQLEITLVDNNAQATSVKPITNKDAYQLFLKGRSFWNLGTPSDLNKAIDFFHQAIAIDPGLALAYSGIADCYDVLGYGSHLSPSEAFPKAKDAALKALMIDSTLAEPHAALGFISFYYDWDWAAAEEEFRKAISRNPNYEIGYKWYGYYLTAMKRYDEAITILKKAGELDPLSVPISTDMGFILYYKGDYDRAINQLKSSLKMNPKFPLAHLWLGRSYQAKRMFAEAINEYKNSLQTTPDWPVGLAQIGNAYGVSNDTRQAQVISDTLDLLSATKFVTAYGKAIVYVGMGENEKAFVWLNKAYQERSNWLVWLKTDPRWIPVRNDRRFAQMVALVGLPE